MNDLSRREAITSLVASLLIPGDSLVETTAKMIMLDVPTDDTRNILHLAQVTREGVENLTPCDVYDNWKENGGKKIGQVKGWRIEGDWLVADLYVPQSVADNLAAKKTIAAPSFFEDHDKNTVTKLKGVDEVAIVPFAEGLWLKNR